MRAFVAIDINPELRRSIVDLQKHLAEPSLKLVEPENLHITLKFIGEVDEKKIPDIIKRLEKIKFPAFEIELAGLGVFPNPNYIRVVWIGIRNGRLTQLAKSVEDSLPEFGKEDFTAHLTIARVKNRPKELLKNIGRFKDVVIGKQLVDRFCLKRSDLKPTGPVYTDLAVFELIPCEKRF